MKTRLVGTEFFHADGRTERYKANSHFQNICERSYKPAITESSKDKSSSPFK